MLTLHRKQFLSLFFPDKVNLADIAFTEQFDLLERARRDLDLLNAKRKYESARSFGRVSVPKPTRASPHLSQLDRIRAICPPERRRRRRRWGELIWCLEGGGRLSAVDNPKRTPLVSGLAPTLNTHARGRPIA